LVILIFYYTSPKGMETNLKVSTMKYKTAFWLEEIARTMETFKLAGNSKLPFKAIDKLLQSYVDYRNKHFGVLVFQYKVMIAFKALIVTTLLVVGSLLLIDNQISIGQFVAAEVIIILIVSSVEKIILSLDAVYDTLTATEKIGQIMDIPMERQEGTEKFLQTNNESLQFQIRNLSFRSKNTTQEILDDVSFELKPGDKAVLTGKSGSGKSTLLYLMSGLFTDYRGRIIVNGLPIDTMNLERLRSYIGDSLSHQSIFHGSIYDNVTLSRDVDDQRVREILALVGLKDFIYQLTEDWDTVLMPEGAGLSKSISSRIILARCLVTQPKALFLEDMIAFLEPEEKAEIIDYILKGAWTVMMISQDLDTIAKFPRVIKLDHGKVIYDGDAGVYVSMNKA
jgi:ABC-type bacteriocin/lantibiotic exporter with double-glycine peptidase domain